MEPACPVLAPVVVVVVVVAVVVVVLAGWPPLPAFCRLLKQVLLLLPLHYCYYCYYCYHYYGCCSIKAGGCFHQQEIRCCIEKDFLICIAIIITINKVIILRNPLINRGSAIIVDVVVAVERYFRTI